MLALDGAKIHQIVLPPPTPENLRGGGGARHLYNRWDNYTPHPDFPSQRAALQALQEFANFSPQKSWWPFGTRKRPQGRGIYLDGGFGVGKTHLLVATRHAMAVRGKKCALLSFQDLMYLIGALKMPGTIDLLSRYDCLLIDEFELDDPGNTHMANTLLEAIMPAGVSVVASSNTAPGALGEGRFSTRDFERQIQNIASLFTSLRVDGPDHRQRDGQTVQPFSAAEFVRWTEEKHRNEGHYLAVLDSKTLQQLLTKVHPSRISELLQEVSAVALTDLQPMSNQNEALRFVHFIDKIYDENVALAHVGAPLEQLFDESYRHGAFAKKYSRCLSRLAELSGEARATLQT